MVDFSGTRFPAHSWGRPALENGVVVCRRLLGVEGEKEIFRAEEITIKRGRGESEKIPY